MYETGPSKGSALDNALWPLKYATNKKTLAIFTPQVIENATQLLAEFDAAFPTIKALADLDREQRKNFAEIQQIPRSKK